MNETSTAREKFVSVKEESVKLKVKILDVEKRLSTLEDVALEDARNIAEVNNYSGLLIM